MTPIRRPAQILAALVAIPLAVSLSACSIGVGGRDSGGDSTSSTKDSPSSSSQESAPSTDESADAASGPLEVQENGEAIASRHVTDSGRDYYVDVISLIDDGDSTVLTLVVRIAEGGESMSPTGLLSVGASGEGAGGVQLLDRANHLLYSVAYTGSEKSPDFVTTGPFSYPFLEPGTTGTYTATFKTLPDDVKVVDVVTPRSGVIEDVPVTHK